MDSYEKERRKNYAKLLIRTGLNIQKGQTLVLSIPVECVEFARDCADAAYDAGCKEVVVIWNDDFLTKQKYLRAEETVFEQYPLWQKTFYEDYSKEGAAFLNIYASDPENLRDVDPRRLQIAGTAAGKALKEYRIRQMSNEISWCVASVPTRAWAQKVFPRLTGDQAEEALWEAIYQAVRITGNGIDAQERWQQHLNLLASRKKTLTAFQFRKLHYSNSLGTDLTVELPEDHIWEAGAELTRQGIPFVANMPTEEIFTAPKRDGVQGVVVSSMPLVYQGNIIDRFSFWLENGKIVRVTAETGEEVLRAAISLDEGASYLGEVALVPYHSPLSLGGLLFYNTLFDENASCHFAFGEAYPCLKNAGALSKEEQTKRGLNDSMTHVDFMIGTPDLSITGVTRDGRAVPVFRQGDFVI